MKCWLISDNADTQMGMRLAGIDGVVVHEHDEAIAAIDKAAARDDIAVIFVTQKVSGLCGPEIAERKLSMRRPLIVAVPDRHGGSHISETLAAYVGEAIGMKL
jgi:V/A-type H+-transporting ATPase subunit F